MLSSSVLRVWSDVAGTQGMWGQARVAEVRWLGCLDEGRDRTYPGRLGPDLDGCLEPSHRP